MEAGMRNIMLRPVYRNEKLWLPLNIVQQSDIWPCLQFNPKVFTSFELYGYMRGEIWKEGILPHLLKDLMGHVECRQLWFVIDCEVDPSWAENLQSLLGDTRLLSLANSENIRLSAQTKVILETKSLRHAAPSIVSRVSVLNTTHSLDWENWVQMWLETSEIVQTRHHCVKALIQQYVPPILNAIGNEMNSVVTVPAIKSVQTLCRLLDALVTNDNIPKNVEDESKIIEKYFAFAAIWAFGSGFTFENKRSFSVFWRQTFKSVRVPSKGTVFDYGIKRAEFISWQSLLEDEEKEAQIKMHSAPANPQHVSYETEEAKLATSKVFIHTTDTIAARTIGGLASAMHLNLLLIGASGTGKTALVEEMLRRLPNGYSKTRYQLTYLSGSHMIQGLFESVLEKKAGKNYGPIAAKNLAIVLDDINMEAVDQFGDQSGLELVRQMLDYKTWYDREKHAEKLLNGTQLIAGMNVARGNDAVNDRLLRHFVIFNQEYSQESLNRIFHARLKTYFEIPKFDPKLCDEAFINKLVLCTVDLHSKMNGLFQKSIETHHYDFDLRHQLRVLDGVRLADSFNFTEPHQLLSLWAHEAERVYRDTLVSQAAYVTFNKMLRDVCKRYFKDIEQKTIFAEPFIFTRLEQDDPNSTYTRILELERVTKQFEACIEKSHQDGNPQAKLFLFDVSIRNVLKIVRLLQMGHALVVSEGGNGKQSLTQLAAYFMHYTVWRLETSINYGIQDLRNEIRDMYMKVGLRDELIVLMITESAIVDEEFLVPFSEVLTTGDLRDAFTAEDKDAVHESLRNFAKDHGHVSDRDTCFQLFRARVMKTLRIALCLEPGPKLRQRMARFSSLQTCTQINWIHPWPVEVLQGVAETFLADVPLPLPSPPDDQSDQSEVDLKVVASSLAASYAIVIQMAADGDARRLQNVRVCLAPKMFLDHLKLFTALITKEGERMRTDMSNLELVMERIAEVNVSVELLEEELTKGAVSIDDAKLEEEALLQTIRNARVNVEEEQANVTAETNREEKLRDALSEQRAACNSILQEGEPAAKAARDAIVSIKARDLIEMKANPNSPHKYIEQVLFAMLALREIPAKNHDWVTAKTMLKDVKSITEDTNKILAAISEGRVESRSISTTRQYMDKEGFDPTEVRKKNPCAGALCESVMNVVRYYDIVSKSQSKLQLMGTTREEHDEAKQNLDKAKNGLKQFQTELENAEKACQVVSESKNKLLEQAKDLQKRRSLAQQLLMAISVEQKLWADQMEQIRAMEPKLLGSALLSSSFVSYMGPMAPVFRKEFVKELLHLLSTNQVDCGKSPDPLRLICTRLMKLAWAQQGLPDDRTALENAAIVCTTTRTPLLIDPHLYFTRWICQKSSSGKVQHESAGSDSLKQKLTSAIECGWTLVVDGVENAVPLFLSRAVAKNIYQKGNSTLISLGDKEVECHPRFRLYLVTRASSPRIDSVVQAECTLIDCTTSMQGLEDVFLRVITQQRQPVIEVMRFETAREYADLELKLEERTVTVLAKLLAAQGSILLDPGLVQSLDGLATLRSDLTVKLNAREEKIEHASKMCQPYRNLAKSCVELYFIAQSLENIDPLYQFSLDAFTSALLNAAVKDIKRPARGFIHVPDFTKAGSDTNPFMRFRVMATLIKGGTKGHLDRGRVQLQASTEDANEGLAVKDSDSLMTSVSVKLCQFVQRGLFARDQLLFVVVVALRRMIKTGAVTRKELQSIIEFGQAAGGVLPDATRHASKVPVTLASFMSERNWQALCALEEVPGLQKLPHDVESSHDRWQRWICEATPEISTLPGVYGRTASPFQRLLILRAVRPDRVQQGFRSFVAENLGPDFVSDHSGETQLVEMYRISRPHMPLLLFSMSRTEETARRITTLIRKKKFGSKVVYLRHGKVSDDDVASDLKYAMKVGRWVVMFDAETRPQWLMLLDRLLQMRETQIDGEFRAFILYNSTTKRTNLEIPNSLVRSSICMTYEAPTSFQATVLKSLAVFDNERFLDRGSSPADQMKFENLVTELAICHASLVHRNSFLSLGWTREYDLSLEQLEEAGQIIVNSVTSSKTLQSSLISKIAETMYGDLVHDVRDMFLVQQSLHDMVQFKRDVNASKGRGDFLPGVRYKDDLTYGEYIKYFQEHDNLENANVLGLHHNASIQVALPKADAFLRYLAVVLEPSMPLDSGRKSVAAASDSLHELLEQLPINFVLDSIRDDVQNLGAMLEPLGYILLQEATRMNMVLDTIRPELRALQASLNGRTNISDHMERLLEAIMSNEVPASWLNVAHDALYGLSKWFIDLLSRVAFLETWKEGLKEGKAAPLSIWLPGLFNPRALMRCAKQMYLRANPSVASWEDLDVCGAVTVWPSESSLEMMADPDAIPTDGLLVHGLFLEVCID
jgi:dynein heavy chain